MNFGLFLFVAFHIIFVICWFLGGDTDDKDEG